MILAGYNLFVLFLTYVYNKVLTYNYPLLWGLHVQHRVKEDLYFKK